ncbi:MAG: Flp family type IVb pilin [Alphaproteobacteria bacterium]|nr:Flp family type IVb pilin [Alphaproteobacteria bacterium]
MFNKLRSLRKDKTGATAIEYGLIAALVSVAAIVALQNMGTSLNTMFTTVSTALDTAVSGGTPPGTGG